MVNETEMKEKKSQAITGRQEVAPVVELQLLHKVTLSSECFFVCIAYKGNTNNSNGWTADSLFTRKETVPAGTEEDKFTAEHASRLQLFQGASDCGQLRAANTSFLHALPVELNIFFLIRLIQSNSLEHQLLIRRKSSR